MPRTPIPTWFFALVIARKGDRFLAVNERDDQGWYLPAGRVEPGESLQAAAVRETLEETGVAVALTGVYRVEFTPQENGARCRVFFSAVEAVGALPPRTTPDEESLGAAWLTLAELSELPQRGDEVLGILRAVERGAQPAPLATVRARGDEW